MTHKEIAQEWLENGLIETKQGRWVTLDINALWRLSA